MKTFAKVFGAVALAAVIAAPAAMARDRGGFDGNTAFGAAMNRGGGGSIGGGGGINRGNFGGGGNFSRAPRFDGGSIARGPRLGNQAFGGRTRGPRFDGIPGRKYGNWKGPGKHHHHRHRRGGLRFYSYGAPYFYDDFYDYGYDYSAFDDDSCGYYYRKWQQTGSSRWRIRYYNCIG